MKPLEITVSGPDVLVQYVWDALKAIGMTVETNCEPGNYEGLEDLDGRHATLAKIEPAPDPESLASVMILNADAYGLLDLFQERKWYKGALLDRTSDPIVRAIARRRGWVRGKILVKNQ